MNFSVDSPKRPSVTKRAAASIGSDASQNRHLDDLPLASVHRSADCGDGCGKAYRPLSPLPQYDAHSVEPTTARRSSGSSRYNCGEDRCSGVSAFYAMLSVSFTLYRSWFTYRPQRMYGEVAKNSDD